MLLVHSPDEAMVSGGPAKVRSWELPRGGRSLGIWAIICCSPRPLAETWMRTEINRCKPHPYGMLAMQGTSLFTMPKFWYIMYNFIHYFNYFKYDMLRFEYFMGIHKCLHIYICIYVYTSVYIYMLYVIDQLNHLDPFIENVRNSLIL